MFKIKKLKIFLIAHFPHKKIYICFCFFCLAVFCGVLSGCHPCSMVQCPGETKPISVPLITRTETFVGKNGNIYIDIVDGESKSHQIDFISILQVKSNSDLEVFWEIMGKEEGVTFPLRYGETVGVKTIKSSIGLESGSYIIKGEVVFFSQSRRYRRFIEGGFKYDKGAKF